MTQLQLHHFFDTYRCSFIIDSFCSCGWSVVSLLCVGFNFCLFLEAWYCLMACITSGAVQWWWVRASFRVKVPSLVRRTPWHTAVLCSSSPISCTTLRKYFWVSFKHCTSVKADKNSTHAIKNLKISDSIVRFAEDYSPNVKLGGWKRTQRKPVKIGGDFPSGPSKPCAAIS